MSSGDLAAAGVRDSDLLIAAEGGGVTIRVRCTTTCEASTIVPTGTTAHIEGHMVVVANHPSPAPSALAPVADLGSPRAPALFRLGIGVLVGVVLLVLVALRLRRAGRR